MRKKLLKVITPPPSNADKIDKMGVSVDKKADRLKLCSEMGGCKMEDVLWRDEYSVGVDLFDRQHRHLFEIINELIAHPHMSPNLELVLQTLKEMSDYAEEHFTDEEKLMQQYAYPEIEEHKRQHSYFVKTIAELSEYPVGKKELSADEIAEFLNVWWIIHILKCDMKYKEFFKAKLPARSEAKTLD